MTKQKIVNMAIITVAIIALALGGYFYYQLKILKTDRTSAAKEESLDLVSKVSKLYLLPAGETPTVATVSDPEILKNQSFFTQSLKGDKVLIYAKAGKAILYRPSIGKIIEVSPVSNNTTSKTENVSSNVEDSTQEKTALPATIKKQ